MYDLHAHFIPQPVLEWLRAKADLLNVRWEKRDPTRGEYLIVGGKWPFELKTSFFTPERFLQEQEEAGVKHTLVSPVPQIFLYDAHPEQTAELAALYNQCLADWVRDVPERLSALGTLPLNDLDAAVHELRRALALGLRGVIVGPGLGGNLLTDARFQRFWEEADRLGALVFLHPLLSEDARLIRPMMPNLIGVPWETTVLAADLILSGLLDRYSRVRLLLAHGGGFLPYQMGRLERGYDQWPNVRAQLARRPREYLRRFWFDSVLWDDRALAYLVALVGEDRVVPGSDYPFDLSAWPPAFVGEAGVRALLGQEGSDAAG